MLPRWGSGRMTPWDDRHIKAKLVELEHTIEENSDSQFPEYLLKTNHKCSSENRLSFHMKLDCYDHISETLKLNNTLSVVMKIRNLR